MNAILSVQIETECDVRPLSIIIRFVHNVMLSVVRPLLSVVKPLLSAVRPPLSVV